MSKLTRKITIPIILVGLFSIAIFVALNYDSLGVGFYIVLLLLAVYIFSFGFATGQNFASPVNKLLEKATELSKGNLSSRVYLKTKDELAELAGVFNKIAEELEESHIDGKMIEKSVDIKTRARTQVLEETILALEQKIRNRTEELSKILEDSKTLQNQMKSREVEIMQLKKDIGELNVAPEKPKKRKIAKK
ncbi:MAG: HAMP domain-containing protein [Candidatus Staskawiczbacteria bacterium]|nr:HAMP domain-containing protein [Candidatus Staskawiczbacteria bacterium]